MKAVAAMASGPVWAAQLFLLSLLIPFHLSVGSVLLMPHRILLLVIFVPFFFRLYILRSAGPVIAIDWLMLGATLWAMVALAVNHPLSIVIEPAGILLVEFFGAYLLARVAIRSGAEFRRMVWTFALLVVVLLPFAAAESLTGRPVLLDLLPGESVRVSHAGERFGMRRAQTIFAHPILYGVFVSTGLGLFWYVLRPRWLRFPAAVMTGLATMFSLSTGALISFVSQSAFIGWEMVLKTLRRRWTLFLVLAVLAYVAVDLLSNRSPFHVLVTYATFSTGSAYNRILIWHHGVENVWDNPIFGLGLNDWVRPVWMSSSIDNFWLFLAMSYGLPAIVMVLAAIFLIVRRTSWSVLPDPGDRLCRAGYLTSLGGLVIAGGTVHYWHAMQAFLLFIVGSGIWILAGGAANPEDQGEAAGDQPARGVRYTRQPAPGVPIGAAPDRRSPPARARRDA